MVIATIFFWAGRNKMVHVPPRGLGYLKEAFLTREGLTILARIAMVYFFILFFWALWGMSNGVEWTLQAQKMDLHWMGLNLIAAQVQTANPNPHSDLHSAVQLFDLSRNGPRLSPHGTAQNRHWLISYCLQFRGHRLDSESDRPGFEPSINWQLLAYVILTLGRDHGLNHWPRVFLYAGAKLDEELGHGALAALHRQRRIFCRSV